MARLTTDLSARLWSGGICTRWVTIRGFANLPPVPPLPSFSERDALFVRLFSGQWGEFFTYEVGSQTREFVVKFGRTMKRASRQKNALKKREVDMRSWKQLTLLMLCV